MKANMMMPKRPTDKVKILDEYAGVKAFCPLKICGLTTKATELPTSSRSVLPPKCLGIARAPAARTDKRAA